MTLRDVDQANVRRVDWARKNLLTLRPNEKPTKEQVMEILQDSDRREMLRSIAKIPFDDSGEWTAVKKWLCFPLTQKDIDALNKIHRFTPPLSFIHDMTVFMVLNQESNGALWYSTSRNKPKDIAELMGRSAPTDFNRPDFQIPEDIRNMAREDVERHREELEINLSIRVREILNTPLSQEFCAKLLDSSNARAIWRILNLADDHNTPYMEMRLITKLLQYTLVTHISVKDEETQHMQSVEILTPLLVALIGADEEAKSIVSGWTAGHPLLTEEVKMMLDSPSSSAGLA